MPPQSTGGGGNSAQGGTPTIPGPVTRSMPEDLRRLSGGTQSVSGSGKVMWPSGTSGTAVQTGTQVPPTGSKTGFLSSLLQSKHHEATAPAPSSSTVQKIPIKGEGQFSSSVWDARVPPVSPRSALPIPQKPITMPTMGATAKVTTTPPTAQPSAPKPSVPSPTVHPVGPSTPSGVHMPTKTSSPIFMDAGVKAPPPKIPAAPPSLRPVPRPATPPPRMITPVSERPSPAISDEDIGIDLGISDYLKGGPTFQIDKTRAPIPTHPPIIRTPVPSVGTQTSQSTAQSLGGVWDPSKMAPTPAIPSPRIEPKITPSPTPTTTIFTPRSEAPTTPPPAPIQATPAQYSAPKPTYSNADLDAEKQRLTNERAQIAGAKSAIEAAIRSLLGDKEVAGNQMKPILGREVDLANEIEELERKEQGLSGEVRRTIERDRWTKVEERRKVEQERMLIKKRLVATEGEIHAKEEEQVSLVRREKDIDARILWINGEYKRREVRMRLAEVNQEKTKIEAQRSVLDNGIKRLKTSLEDAERNERRLMELKRSLAIKMPQTIAEEERYAQERFDIEKQMHDMELRRWSLEDELKNMSELFAKEDMAYLDVMHRAEALEGELKALG